MQISLSSVQEKWVIRPAAPGLVVQCIIPYNTNKALSFKSGQPLGKECYCNVGL